MGTDSLLSPSASVSGTGRHNRVVSLEERPLGVYRTNDPITNLRIRVRLWEAGASAFPVELFENGNGHPSLGDRKGASREEEVVLQWQQKVLSGAEQSYYREKRTDYDDLAEKFHRMSVAATTTHPFPPRSRTPGSASARSRTPVPVGASAKVSSASLGGAGRRRIFTYTNAEKVREDGREASQEATRKLVPTFPVDVEPVGTHGPVIPGVQAPSLSQDTLEACASGESRHTVQDMFIVAHPTGEDSCSLSDLQSQQVLLCSLRWYPASQTLVVYPDFNQQDGECYEATSASSPLQFRLEHCSPQQTEMERYREEAVLTEFLRRQEEGLRNCLGEEFESSAQLDTLRIHVEGQLDWASGFSDGRGLTLVVLWTLEMASGWKCEDPLQGTTFACRTGNSGRAHFGCPLSFDLFQPLDGLLLSRPPTLVLQVVALDFWGRQRLQGYGSVAIPTSPGAHHIKVDCWRPIPTSPIECMREFFLGASPQLTAVKGLALQDQASRMSRYGLPTTASGGSLHLTLYIAKQSPHPGDGVRNTLEESLQASQHLKLSLKRVIDAFHQARDRMREVRETAVLESKRCELSFSQPFPHISEILLSSMVNRAGQARSGSSFFTGPPTESGVKLINVVILGVAFMLIFTAFQTMGIIEQTIIHSIRQDNPRFTGDGYTSLAILYVVFALSNWLAPAVVYSIGGKYSMMIGAVTYAFFIGSFIKPMEWTLYLSSGLLGLGAAMLWCGQGMFLTKNSDQDTMGRNSGIFWALLQCSLLFGNLYVFYEFAGHSYISQEKRSHLVWVFLALTLIGFGLLCVLRRQVADENVDQEPGVVFEPVTQLYRSYNLLMTKEMVLLTFTFLYTGLELSFFSGVYGSCIGFTEDYGDRRKQLVGLSGIFIGLGEILGGALFGILGMRTAVYGRDPIVLLGMLTHVTTFFIIFLILPFDAPFGETESIAFLQPR
ncbi:unnamed protein product [Cyprideis torosa]|uniref:UNC93-like protein MFSD11 n=1 Tax=Cyprideis torosa TaxID=163714 RepID=A0A7R8W3Z7_9CRUS|nr:unnamed protein product [Cyprideis torosa]CAG0883570.1 unnamed protein product [Cyprideis torosa]